MKRIIFSLAMVVTGNTCPASAGEVRNGGDLRPDWESSAWFIGDGAVHYCYEVAPDFGAKADTTESTLHLALNAWGRYVLDKQIRGKNPAHRMATDYRLNASCDGSEDLKIKLGGLDGETRQAQEKLVLQDPIALAYRTAFDPQTGWGKGFIWIASSGPDVSPGRRFPDWSVTYAFYSILLHEMGHVFGNGHVDGTVMTEDIVHALQAHQSDRVGPPIDHIDWEKELYSCIECFLPSKEGLLALRVGDVATERRNFAFLTGRDAEGYIYADISQAPLSQSSYTGRLKLQDDSGTVELPFSLNAESDSRHIGPVVFASVINGQFSSEHQGASIQFGTMDLPNDKKIPIIVERNMNNRAVSLSSLENGIKMTLFYSFSHLDPKRDDRRRY